LRYETKKYRTMVQRRVELLFLPPPSIELMAIHSAIRFFFGKSSANIPSLHPTRQLHCSHRGQVSALPFAFDLTCSRLLLPSSPFSSLIVVAASTIIEMVNNLPPHRRLRQPFGTFQEDNKHPSWGGIHTHRMSARK